MRNELDRRSHPGDAEYHQDDASHQRRDDQPVDAEALHDSVNDYDERSGRSSDLDTRSTQRGDQKPRDDRGIKPAIRRHTAGDGKGNCERKCHDADDDAGHHIRRELGPVVRLEGRN